MTNGEDTQSTNMTASSSQKLSELKQQRGTSKGSITRVKNVIDTNQNLSSVELECRLSMIEAHYKQGLHYQAQIERLDPTDTGRVDLEEAYVAVKTALMTKLSEFKQDSTLDTTFLPPVTPNHRLPNLKLPRFDGKYLEYKNFINSFKTLIHNDTTVPLIDKFNHLVSCLHGEALATIKALQVTEANYPKALQRLNDRYDNDTLIFLENISEIFDIEKVQKPESKPLRNIIDTAAALYASLTSLGNYEQICDALIIHLVINKVDTQTKQKWDESLDYSKLPSWSDCCTMLDKRCQQLDVSRRSNMRSQSPSKQQASTSKNKRTSLSAKADTEITCLVCNKKGHNFNSCQVFIAMPFDQRFQKVKQLNLCLNCLGKSHVVSQCQSKFSCRFCKQRHHSLLHKQEQRESTSKKPDATLEPQMSTSAPSTSATVHTARHADESSTINQVLLATALILVKDVYGHHHLGRALLDSGSQVNFINEPFSRMLNLKRARANVNIEGYGSKSSKIKLKTQTVIRSRINEFELSLEFLISKNITGYHPDKNISIEDLQLPSGIDLADPQFNISHNIDMLLGAEVFFSLLGKGQIRLGKNLPTIQQTEFGWVVSGNYVSHHRSKNTASLCTTIADWSDPTMDTIASINKGLQKFWHVEEAIGKREKLSIEQQECERHFIDTTTIDDSGRITVRLPFKTDPDVLGNSQDIALRRFLSLEKKLDREPNLKSEYVKFMKEYEELGHMSLLPELDLTTTHFFIPHHSVLKPSSETTKLRVVFDASCRSASQISLNEILMVGPTIQADLLVILLRFRNHRYGLMADISKMYRQILVAAEDRKFQRIFWRANKTEPISIYELNTVTYGTASAPFLAIRSVHYAADQYAQSHQLGQEVIKNDFYVDDMVTGAENLETLIQIRKEVEDILSKFKFTLAKWHCSHPDLKLDSIRNMKFDDDSTSALGVGWYPNKDKFVFSFKPNKDITKVTKRLMLSIVSSLFDPMGLVSPLVIKAKILLQSLWVEKCDWDDEVSSQIRNEWHDIITNLSALKSLEIPRFVGIANKIDMQLHGFADASLKAYGCCLYIRCKDSFGNVSSNLLASKSRVAPLKQLSIPRLELCAAHLLSKFWHQLQPQLKWELSKIYFWSDSQLVLHWQKSHSSKLSTFVGNRVAEIQENSSNIIWRYVPTHVNPADLISRGCAAVDINSNWLNGPVFLQKEEIEWPENFQGYINKEDLQSEQRKSTLSCVKESVPYVLEKIHNISSYTKCLRTIAYIMRPKYRQESLVISALEMEMALHRMVWLIQQHHFREDIRNIEKGQLLKGQLASLNPFIDQTCNVPLLRVGGRLVNADISMSSKFPLLLPKDDNFVKTLVRHVHQSNYHAGPRAITALVQQQFWIINLRSLASQVVKNCVLCTRYQPKLQSQIMGNLPKERVTGHRAFETVGVDFAGPIMTYLKIRGKRPYKTYIAVFICFATKAVHLEAVSDLSTDAFIASLKRFVSRRGLPNKIVCDNATNFVGAARKLKEFSTYFNEAHNKNAIVSYCAAKGVEFLFIPPRAPHFGGLWEAAVKTAKSHFLRTLGTACLTFEELTTALAEIEAIMNSRPLTAPSTDPNDLEPITPAHFLIGTSLKQIPELGVERNISHHLRWQRITAAKTHFWRRWRQEYLSGLLNRQRWRFPTKNVNIGDMVIIHDDNLPPMQWVVGRILNIISGPDGHVRVVDIKTPSTILRRPITKVAILPIT